MSDLAIFLFGTFVTVIVGAALTTLIVWKNRVEERPPVTARTSKPAVR